MNAVINPFDVTPGFTLAEMTEAINLQPNEWGLINQLGIFRDQGVTQNTVLIEQKDGVLNLLPTRPRGAPATTGTRDPRSMRSFAIPHIPHDDVVLPEDIQGIRPFGQNFDQAEVLATVMDDKLAKMRTRHAQTHEYMRLQALKGILIDGAGTTLYNYFDEFGVTQHSTDFVLGTSSTDIGAKCREILRFIRRNLKGETMNGVLVLVDPSFWDKFIKHDAVKDAFKFYTQNAAQQPLRDDVRDGFRFHGITFREYDATFTLSDGSTTDEAFDTDYGIAFPLGTTGTFVQYNAPANLMETVNTIGQPMYARQIARDDGTGIDVKTQSNPLPMVRRPLLSVQVRSSN